MVLIKIGYRKPRCMQRRGFCLLPIVDNSYLLAYKHYRICRIQMQDSFFKSLRMWGSSCGPANHQRNRGDSWTIFNFSTYRRILRQIKCPKTNVNTSFWGTCLSGAEGNRTPVRKPIPCSSTIIVLYLTFPLPSEKGHPDGFSSFIIRPYAQSFA